MTRTRTLLLTTAFALTVPLAAFSQTATGMKCGPEVFSAATMSYTSGPCTGAVSVGENTPSGAINSTTMTKAEMKQGAPIGYAPMQAQAVSGGPAMMGDQCGNLGAVAITDEYGRKYNCRGDLIRRHR